MHYTAINFLEQAMLVPLRYQTKTRAKAAHYGRAPRPSGRIPPTDDGRPRHATVPTNNGRNPGHKLANVSRISRDFSNHTRTIQHTDGKNKTRTQYTLHTQNIYNITQHRCNPHSTAYRDNYNNFPYFYTRKYPIKQTKTPPQPLINNMSSLRRRNGPATSTHSDSPLPRELSDVEHLVHAAQKLLPLRFQRLRLGAHG